MSREIIVTPEPLTVESFAPYGQAILVPQPPIPKSGDNWDCWFGLGTFSKGEMVVGFVATRPTEAPITTMERETKTEFLIPITGPLIQTVAKPGNLSIHTEQPDADSVKAFIIQPGQAIIMGEGTWHWAALPLEQQEVLYYFITEPHPPEPGREASPWVPFINNDIIHLRR